MDLRHLSGPFPQPRFGKLVSNDLAVHRIIRNDKEGTYTGLLALHEVESGDLHIGRNEEGRYFFQWDKLSILPTVLAAGASAVDAVREAFANAGRREKSYEPWSPDGEPLPDLDPDNKDGGSDWIF